MTAEEIAAGLGRYQRAVVRAGSKRPKKWMTIRRHAKVPDTVRVHQLHTPLRLFDHGPEWWRGYFLTPLGQQVRAILESNHDRA